LVVGNETKKNFIDELKEDIDDELEENVMDELREDIIDALKENNPGDTTNGKKAESDNIDKNNNIKTEDVNVETYSQDFFWCFAIFYGNVIII